MPSPVLSLSHTKDKVVRTDEALQNFRDVWKTFTESATDTPGVGIEISQGRS